MTQAPLNSRRGSFDATRFLGFGEWIDCWGRQLGRRWVKTRPKCRNWRCVSAGVAVIRQWSRLPQRQGLRCRKQLPGLQG